MSLWNMQPKIKVSWGLDKPKEKEKKPKLIDMAKEKFGEDKLLMIWIETFLSEKRQQHLLPTHLAWEMQLLALEKYPPKERLAQVKRSIQNGYRAIAYEPKNQVQVSNVKDKQQADDEVNYSKAY